MPDRILPSLTNADIEQHMREWHAYSSNHLDICAHPHRCHLFSHEATARTPHTHEENPDA